MAKKEFAPAREAAELSAAVNDEETTAVATRPTVQLGAYVRSDEAPAFKLPRVSIVYGVGDLSTKFSPGSLVIDKEHLLAQRGEKLDIVILGALEYYKENRKFQPNGAFPQTFNTRKEAEAAGFKYTDEWWSEGSPTVSLALNMRLMARKPDAMTTSLFTIDVLGEKFIPFEWLMDKMACAKTREFLSTASCSLASRGLLSGKIELSIRSEVTKNGKTLTYPVYRLTGFNTDEWIEALRTQLPG